MARFRDTLLRLLGSSSGETILKAAATASGTITLPAVTDTVAVLGTAQTFTATQTFNVGASNTVKLGQYTSGTTYNILSFNGDLSTAGLGIIGGSAGDNTIYIHAPTGGACALQVGGTNILVAQAAGITLNSALAVASGGTGDTGTSWTSYTPTVVAASGTLTTVSATGRWKSIGKTVFVNVNVTITTNGTGSGAIRVGLPPPVGAAITCASGRENALTGNMLQAVLGGTTMDILTYNNGYPGGTGANIFLTAVYEST